MFKIKRGILLIFAFVAVSLVISGCSEEAQMAPLKFGIEGGVTYQGVLDMLNRALVMENIFTEGSRVCNGICSEHDDGTCIHAEYNPNPLADPTNIQPIRCDTEVYTANETTVRIYCWCAQPLE